MSEASQEIRLDLVKEKLFSAVENGDFETVSGILEPFPEDLLRLWSPGFGLICTALKNKHLEIAKFLLNKNLKTYNCGNVEQSVLHLAVLHGNLDIVRTFVETKWPVLSEQNCEGLTAMCMLAKRIPVDEECIKILDYFIHKREYINNKHWPSGFTLLHYAAKYGNVDLVSVLLERNSYLNAKSTKSLTPLHVAAMNGQSQIINVLLQQPGIKLNLKDDDEKTPLCLAVENGHLESIQLLSNRIIGSKRSLHLSKNYNLLIYCAVVGRNKEVVETLLEKGGEVNVYYAKTGKTPLHVAVENGDEEIIKLLLAKGAKSYAVQVRTHESRKIEEEINQTPLHIAARIGSSSIVLMLLNTRCNLDLMFTQYGIRGYTPLHIAVENGHQDIVQIFMERRISASLTTINGLEALHIAAQKGDLGIVQQLLEYGAQVDTLGQKVVVIYLFIDSDLENSEVYNVIRKDYHNNPRVITWEEVFTPLYIASYYGHLEVVKTLLDKGCNPNAVFKHGLTPLHAAAQEGHEEIVKLLLESGAIFETGNGNKDVETDIFFSSPLLGAAQGGHEGIVKLLLNKGANVARKFRFPSVSILKAIKHVFNSDTHFNLKGEELRVGYTSLHFAAATGKKSLVDLIIKYGADVNAKSKRESTPLDIAIKKNHTEVVRSLLEAGANVNFMCSWKFKYFKMYCPPGLNDGFTPLHIAIMRNNTEIVEMLLQKGSFVNLNGELDFPLHFAVNSGNKDIITNLIKYGARVNSLCTKGLTPFFHAVEQSKVISAKLLLANGASFESQNQEGKFLLDFAIDCKADEKMIEFLLSCGADVNARNESGLTLLHRCLSESTSSWERDSCYSTSKERNIWLFKTFLENGANANEWLQNSDETILHLAARTGRFEEVNYLLENDADINRTNKKGNTPLLYPKQKIILHLSEFRSYQERLGLLVGQDIEYNLTDSDYGEYNSFERNRRLHTSTNSSSYDDDPTPYRMIARSIIQRIARLVAAEKDIHEQNLTIVNDSFMQPYFALCQAEIKVMKHYEIANKIRVFDVLIAEERMLALYARNKKIVKTLLEPSHDERFPLYMRFLKTRILRGVKRNSLLDESHRALKKALGFTVPFLISCEIFNYLNLIELSNLCKACKSFRFKNFNDDEQKLEKNLQVSNNSSELKSAEIELIDCVD